MKKANNPKSQLEKMMLEEDFTFCECNFAVKPTRRQDVNLPRVTAQLEKLMGTNVVRLTDRKYMQELQRRIQEDYNVTLEKRISEREAKEIERERNLILSGAGDSIPEEMTSSVFLVNQKTNVNILNKREKLKTIREKNAERLIKQGHRWERERLQMEEQSREREIERRTKREALLEQEKLYMIEENDRSLNLLRVKTKKGPCRDMNLRSVLMQQREELGRSIQKRDFDMKDDLKVDADGGGGSLGRTERRRGGRRGQRKQHQMQRQHEVSEYQESSSPEEGYISMANADSPDGLQTSIAIKVAKGASRDSGDESEGEQEDSDTAAGGKGPEKDTLELGVPEENGSEHSEGMPEETEEQEPEPEEREATEAELEAAEEARLREELDKTLMEKKKARQVRNEDPKITKLKEADTVADIYNVADEIIVLEKKKSKKGFGK
uniref:M12 mutant protein n=1 Tax=Anopheles atroparvus TaxID=41427 RepID=A0A182JD83_ANOAO